MKDILIICAMDEEITRFTEMFYFEDKQISENFHYYEGEKGNLRLRLAKSGIGKVQVAMTTSYLISQRQPDLVINTGSAGAIDPNVRQRDCIIADGAFYHDVDMTAFGYELGQLSGHDLIFKTEPSLTDQLMEIDQKLYGAHAKRGLIATGDSFVSSNELKNKIFTEFPKPLCAEMEGAAIGQVCSEFGVEFGEIRSISDDNPDESANQFDETIDDAGLMAAEVAIEYINQLSDKN
ncbi:5'-methylthioadenosine/adenosylhomocysteine nucleosidase [Xylocopilactobacillus apis]|uniref:adenosylhomocysteine nucleosidase n=1 Tax=Xylocopilactobacillus apis TaxID=2932183 RepID=A0AAU9DKU7_9LACO|nr:5'-methylthioadenosine/adenosylhomocysteine nucleosidase [Xylocopilactobacillus apis]BDR56149.1 5'-methylthioadenosine/S-adenosylhomocysteine nucleosidase [Xylocopilactobacillus apis]